MLANLLLAIAVALALFFLSKMLFDSYIDKKYLSEDSKTARINGYRDALQNYVTENNLDCDDTDKISTWAKAQKYLYILVYKDDQLLFETGRYVEEKVENKENADDSTEKPEENNPDSPGETDPDGTDPGVTDPDGTDPDGTDPGGTDPGGTDPGGTDPGITDPGVTDPDGTDPDGTDPGGTDPGGTDPGGTDPGGTDPGVTDPEGDKPGEDKNEEDKTDKEENKYQSSGITIKTPTRQELYDEAIAKAPHSITAADGMLIVKINDFTEYLYYDIFNIVSIVLASIGFILVMWFYFFGITKKISRLGREVTAVADGDVNRKITTDGDDELTRLCADVEYMRISMLENIEKERAALEANKELITAMSHDIRTPLTVLLGYLDVMRSNATDEDMQQYIEVSERTAMRLKKMSDDMFGYFLVYGGSVEVDVQECEARTLVDQMFSGHVFLLREQGYTIDFNFEECDNDFLEDVTVVTDPPQLMRIVENLFSNILKYADIEKPVTINIDVDIDEMTIKVSNYVHPNPDEAQKNGIGLRSSMKLANAMDIRFSAEETDGIYTSVLCVPIIPNIDYASAEKKEDKRGFSGWLKYVFKSFKSFVSTAWGKLKSLFVKEK